MNELLVGRASDNGKILRCPEGMNSPEHIGRKGTVAEKIVFLSLFHGTSPLPLSRGERGVGIMV
jgi:hypothetical protein